MGFSQEQLMDLQLIHQIQARHLF